VRELQRQANEATGAEMPEEEIDTELRIGDDFQSMLPTLQGPADGSL
jgi:hypothetical protein